MRSLFSTHVTVKAAKSRLAGIGSTCRTLLGAFSRDRSGASFVLVGISLPVLLGVGALAVDVGSWYASRRQYQTATDAAAIAAAWERIKGNGYLLKVAQANAARNGVIVGGPVAMTLNNPPLSGPNAGKSQAVEVIITVAEKTMLSSLVYSGGMTNRVRSVASVITKGSACILALDRYAMSAVKIWGETNVSAVGCVIAANSTNSYAVNIGGDAVLTAESLWSAGGVQMLANVTLATPPTTNAWALDDPYASLTVQGMPSTCLVTNPSPYTKSVTLNPGRYCLNSGGALTFKADATVTLTPGTYYIDGGDMIVNGGARFRCACGYAAGQGVTFVFTSSTSPSAIGTVHINGGAEFDLRAPTTGYYAGILFYQDQRAPSGTAEFNGGATMVLNGAIYFKNQQVMFSGSNTASATSCLQIIGNTVEISGETKLINNGCAAAGIKPVEIKGVAMVE